VALTYSDAVRQPFGCLFPIFAPRSRIRLSPPGHAALFAAIRSETRCS